MAPVLQSKVVSALPGVLTANTIYYVRVGAGFDLHVTNALGTVVAYGLNLPPPSQSVGDDAYAASALPGVYPLGWTLGYVSTAAGYPMSGYLSTHIWEVQGYRFARQMLTQGNNDVTIPTVVAMRDRQIDNNAWSGWTVLGGTRRVVTVTAAYTVRGFDNTIRLDASGGAFTVTLPSAATVSRPYTLKKVDTSGNAVTVAAVNGQLIDGAASLIISRQNTSLTLETDGSNWMVT